MSQYVLGKSARAVPQEDGSGVRSGFEMSSGMELRGKPQTRMPASRTSTAYTWNLDQYFSSQGGGQGTYTAAFLVELLAIHRRATLHSTARVPVLIVAG